MQRTQEALKVHGYLRLHKIASNKKNIMKAFPNADLAMDVKDLSFEHDNLPLQRSLCLFWNLDSDAYTFQVAMGKDSYSRR